MEYVKIDIIKSGSRGNAVLYDTFMVDCGVKIDMLKDKEISHVFLTHKHKDHIHTPSVKWLLKNGIKVYSHRTNKRFLKKELGDKVEEVIFIKENEVIDVKYNIANYSFFIEEVDHDVRNFCIHLNIKSPFGEQKVFHATDCGNLNGISAINYDVYALETNYSRDKIKELIKEDLEKTSFSRFIRSTKYHLAQEQAMEFVDNNSLNGKRRFVRLHKSVKAL